MRVATSVQLSYQQDFLSSWSNSVPCRSSENLSVERVIAEEKVGKIGKNILLGNVSNREEKISNREEAP